MKNTQDSKAKHSTNDIRFLYDYMCCDQSVFTAGASLRTQCAQLNSGQRSRRGEETFLRTTKIPLAGGDGGAIRPGTGQSSDGGERGDG